MKLFTFSMNKFMHDLGTDIRRNSSRGTPLSPLDVAYGAKRPAPHEQLEALFQRDTEEYDSHLPIL